MVRLHLFVVRPRLTVVRTHLTVVRVHLAVVRPHLIVVRLGVPPDLCGRVVVSGARDMEDYVGGYISDEVQ